ncbi:outer membrane beta-barrel protein [Jiella sp. MQZ9-1]|uniref:Porin family protein n=1 Tax=Jiella flava TaxID=2816857 RepID=A0A939G1R6_9HYPH|nr:outer membrane beta-barrel protein [Jiella flava]MBO0663557.1 porin family protein [Jiella flava]MCD2472132.1 outer membrane beta-barrel protein [Jiella flava]
MKRFALLLASAAFASPAMAADVIAPEPPAPAPVAIQPVAPTITWTGLSLGVQAGATFGHNGDASFSSSNDPTLYNGNVGGDDTGNFIGGANIGYDYQFQNNVVLGAVADFNYINRKKDTSYTTPNGAEFSAQNKLNYLGTARARLGYAMDNILVYGTGGLAYGSVKNSVSTPSTTTGDFAGYTFSTDNEKKSVGYTAGAGVDVMATQNLSFGVEYLYTNLGKNTQTVTGTNGVNNVSFNSNSNKDLDFHTVWAKAAYHFN